MPPKRKSPSNKDAATASASPKAAKSCPECAAESAAKSSPKPKSRAIKYSDASTLSEKPKHVNLQWPNIEDFMDDKDQDMPKDGELMDEYCNRVSDLGIPVSEGGAELLEKLDKEVEKRDQDSRGLFIYNDWNGWGMSEVMENLLKDFNRDVFKKSISPYRKWAYVEALACFLKGADLCDWMGNEDGDSVRAVVDMLGVMVLTSYEVLSEHDLFKSDSDIKNIGIMSLILLEFLKDEACDLDTMWGCEVVRLCDEAGIELEKDVRKQVNVSKEHLKELREFYKEKKEASEFGRDDECDGNGYMAFAKMKSWKPQNDIGGEAGEKVIPYTDGKMWYRWDWSLEYKEFQENHKGGTHYDLSKMSKKELAAHRL